MGDWLSSGPFVCTDHTTDHTHHPTINATRRARRWRRNLTCVGGVGPHSTQVTTETAPDCAHGCWPHCQPEARPCFGCSLLNVVAQSETAIFMSVPGLCFILSRE